MSFWENLTSKGLRLPYAYDPVTDKASVTLLFPYIVFLVAVAANIWLIFKDTFVGTITAIIFWALATVFYMIRSLNKAKFDLDDKSLELESEDEDNEKGGSDETN